MPCRADAQTSAVRMSGAGLTSWAFTFRALADVFPCRACGVRWCMVLALPSCALPCECVDHYRSHVGGRALTSWIFIFRALSAVRPCWESCFRLCTVFVLPCGSMGERLFGGDVGCCGVRAAQALSCRSCGCGDSGRLFRDWRPVVAGVRRRSSGLGDCFGLGCRCPVCCRRRMRAGCRTRRAVRAAAVGRRSPAARTLLVSRLLLMGFLPARPFVQTAPRGNRERGRPHGAKSNGCIPG